MAVSDPDPFPLVALRAVANENGEWVALRVHVEQGCDALRQVFASHDLLSAVAPLDCVLATDPACLDGELLAALPSNRVILAVAGAALADEAATKTLCALRQGGYRILLDGPPAAASTATASAFDRVGADCSRAVPALSTACGPHLAYGVDSAARLAACRQAGYGWFSGNYAIDASAVDTRSDGTSRQRLLALLGLLARDADSRELECLLKQDPALSFHLLKLVNSAAFAVSTPIHSFGQAINVLGRRQLQRWLQLLLYARPHEGPGNPLLPVAAQRGAQMEALCKQHGGERDEQDLAFMVGVFSLLDVLLGMPMDAIVATLSLPAAAAGALRTRAGPLGQWLALAEAEVDHARLARAGVSSLQWWQSQLHAFHWAIQVSRNV